MLFDEITQVLDPAPHGAALNMAIDEVLFQCATDVILRIYRWARPAVSFGYFEKVAPVRSAWPDLELVRRWTGGGVVLHGEDFTYTLIVPAGCAFLKRSTAESYRAIHECLAPCLASPGAEPQVATSPGAKISTKCFENTVRYDLTDGAKKIAGAAQRRTKWGLLHQGSIEQIHPRPNLATELAASLASHLTRRPLDADRLEAAKVLAREKYGTEAWTNRR